MQWRKLSTRWRWEMWAAWRIVSQGSLCSHDKFLEPSDPLIRWQSPLSKIESFSYCNLNFWQKELPVSTHHEHKVQTEECVLHAISTSWKSHDFRISNTWNRSWNEQEISVLHLIVVLIFSGDVIKRRIFQLIKWNKKWFSVNSAFDSNFCRF